MKSRVLLVNFPEKATEKLRELTVSLENGYLTDVTGYLAERGGGRDEIVKYSFPRPVYEYKVVFINLNSGWDASEEKLKALKFEQIHEEIRKDFFRFWDSKGILIVFLGDYKYQELLNIGIAGITLEKVAHKDESIFFNLSRNNTLKRLFEELKPQVLMPTDQYIVVGKELRNARDLAIRTVYYNRNDKTLGCYYTQSRDYDDEHYPRFILLPQFKDNCKVIEKTLKALSRIDKKFLPELFEQNWTDSEKYYPKEVSLYDSETEEIISEAKTKLAEVAKKKKDAKENFEHIRGLLYQTGDRLKENVIKVLTTVFNVNVSDSDKEKEGVLPNEDLIIDINKRKILAEVKGVTSENPSPLFIGQVWKHLAQIKEKDITAGALILNHDLNTEPEERKLAYTGELETSLDDIIFIDTRVMYYLSIAIIDHGLSTAEATGILFKKGRVVFDLKEYIKTRK